MNLNDVKILLNESFVNNLITELNYYFPTLQIRNSSDIIAKIHSSSGEESTNQEIKKIIKHIQLPKEVSWAIPRLDQSIISTTKNVTQDGKVKKVIVLNMIILLNVIGCLFLRIWKSQIWAIGSARRIALNTVLSFNVIGLIFLGIKGFQLWKNAEHRSGSLSIARNEEGMRGDKIDISQGQQYQNELRALRLIQYYTFVHACIFHHHPGGRWLDSIRCLIQAFPVLFKGERVFTPQEFEMQLQDVTFVQEYRSFIEEGTSKIRGLQWVGADKKDVLTQNNVI